VSGVATCGPLGQRGRLGDTASVTIIHRLRRHVRGPWLVGRAHRKILVSGQFPESPSIVQNTVVMAFTKGSSGAVAASPGGRSAGRDSDPWYGDAWVLPPGLGPTRGGCLFVWRYKNFVQSGEWALTVIAPTGGHGDANLTIASPPCRVSNSSQYQ
jgi:hypothetical protein